jgi:UPF0755 protein
MCAKLNFGNNTKKLLISLLCFSFVALVTIGIQYYAFIAPNFSVPANQKALLYIADTTTIDDIIMQMEEGKWIRNSTSFKNWAKRKNYTVNHTGCYEIQDGMSNKKLISILASGLQKPVRFTINNIRTKTRLASSISNQLMLDSMEIMKLLCDTAFLGTYNVDRYTVIGLFIPNTYELYWNIPAKRFFDRIYSEYNHFWNENRRAKAKVIGLTPMEISTLASIVEEETNIKKDKPIIAGLYLNRLKIGMPLQACPTAKFASGDFSLTRILEEHTKIDSPYNTYKYKGLPPGPIRMPSIESIDAVLNYQKSNYLYMCAKETLNGEHNFASTLSQHQQNSRRYYQALKKAQQKPK